MLTVSPFTKYICNSRGLQNDLVGAGQTAVDGFIHSRDKHTANIILNKYEKFHSNFF